MSITCDRSHHLWFSPSTLVSSTNKTDRHNITEILLKVALNTITLIQYCFGFLSIEDRDQQIVSDFYVFLGGKTYLFCLASISVHPSENFCNCNSLYILSMYSSKLGMLLYYHMKIRLFIVMKVWLNYFWRNCCPFLQLEYFIKKLYMQVLLHFILNSLNSTICEGVIALFDWVYFIKNNMGEGETFVFVKDNL